MIPSRSALAVLAGVAAVVAVAAPVALMTGRDGPGPRPASSSGSPRSAETADGSEPPAPTGSATPGAGTPGETIPEDFPLTAGYPATNGNDGSPVHATDEPGIADLVLCGRTAWSPVEPVRAADVAGASYTGEAEDFRGRALAVYAHEDQARTALSALADQVDRCGSEMITGTEQVWSTVRRDGESVVVTHRFRGDQGFDVGLEVIQAVRRGNALLVAFQYGEGGGSAAAIDQSIKRLRVESSPVIDAMCRFDGGCSPSEPTLVIGPEGVGDLTLGMSVEEVSDLAEVSPSRNGTGCFALSYPVLSSLVVGDLSREDGVTSLTAIDARTPEGIGSDSSYADVLAAYPAAEGDEVLLTSPVTGYDDRHWRIWFDRAGRVDEIRLVLDEQHCAG